MQKSAKMNVQNPDEEQRLYLGLESNMELGETRCGIIEEPRYGAGIILGTDSDLKLDFHLEFGRN